MDFDLVYKEPYSLIVIKDDNWYEHNASSFVKTSVYDLKKCSDYLSVHADPKELFKGYDALNDPLGAVLIHYALHYEDFTICDVGAHYGETTMDFVRIAARAGGKFRAFAFDAGIAAQLTWRNFENNGFNDIVFECAAVGAVDGHGIMYREPAESTGNRVILGGTESYPVRFVSLDSYLAKVGAAGPAVVKIDVQGAEPLVIRGMETLLNTHPTAMLFEYTPWAIRESGQDPTALLFKLMETHSLFDVGYNREHVLQILEPQRMTFDVDTTSPYWRDILAVPYDVREFDDIHSKILSFCKAA